MARVALSAELSAYVAARITSYSEESPETQKWAAPFVAKFGALPLYFGWCATIGLRPDGEIVEWSTEGEYVGTRPVEERFFWLSGLVKASRQYPRLRQILPERPANAVDCHHLAHPLFTEGKVSCPECCGLGWVSAKARPTRS
jgi:hypothetical protein